MGQDDEEIPRILIEFVVEEVAADTRGGKAVANAKPSRPLSQNEASKGVNKQVTDYGNGT